MSWDPFGLFGDLNHMIITRNDTAEPRDSNFLNSGIRPDSWVGWSHVQNYEQSLLSHSWKDRLTWNGPDSLGSTDFPPAYQHSQTAGMCSLPAAEPLHLSMYWKALMTPFSPRLYTHFAFMTGLGKRDCVATVALKRDSCGSAMTHVSICRIWQLSKSSWDPLPLGVLAALPQQSPERQKWIQEEQRRWLGGSLLLARAKAPYFLKGHNACATGRVRRPLPFVCYKKSAQSWFFFSMLQKAWGCFAQARFISALLISCTHTHTQLSPVSLLCKLTLKRVLWSQAQAGQSLSSQQGAAQTIQAEKSAPQTTGIWLFFLFKFCVLST